MQYDATRCDATLGGMTYQAILDVPLVAREIFYNLFSWAREAKQYQHPLPLLALQAAYKPGNTRQT